MLLKGLENAPNFAETWNQKESPYELPNGEEITDMCNKKCYLTIQGQKHSIKNTNENIVALVRKPTKEVFAGYELFFILEKTGIFSWRFKTIDIDGLEEIHSTGRYSSVTSYMQAYMHKYDKFSDTR